MLSTITDSDGWRTCSKCRHHKPSADFSSRTSGYCKDCFRQYRRDNYVPVGDRSKKKRAEDPIWKAKHDVKTCIVCKKPGSIVAFKTLQRHRCAECEAKGIFWCKVHGSVRPWPCRRCTRKNARDYRAKKKLAVEAKAEKSILLMTGDGRCARCGKRIREAKVIDRGHRCG